MKQGTDEWHEQRLGKITASRFKDVMTNGRGKDTFGKVAISYAMELVTEMKTGERKDVQAKQMDWGHSYENDARIAYQLKTFNKVHEAGYIEMDDQVGGSPDGLIGENGIIEIKCPFSPVEHLKNLCNKTVPDEYIPQVQGYLMITGRQWCDFVSYDVRWPDDQKLMICRVERDEEYITELEMRIVEFKNVINRILEKL
jgi:putative phage-type endonuclease